MENELEKDQEPMEMEQFENDFDINEDDIKTVKDEYRTDTQLNAKLNEVFAGKVVRKDLTKKIKEGANVPVYVLEYLLGMYKR